jgi:hypothetical protein
MRPIRLPEPESEPEPPGGATPEIFAAGGAAAVVRRAVVIGNGCSGAEGQCVGLLRALGLADRLTLYVRKRPEFPHSLVRLMSSVHLSFYWSTYYG